MRVSPGRFAGLTFATAIVVLAVLVIGNGLTHDALVEGVRGKDLGRIAFLLRLRPSLARAKVPPQGSSRGSVWRGRYVIHDAVSTGDVAVAELLVGSGADLRVRLDGDSLLHLAASDGKLEMMRWLIGKGANVNDRNDCKGCEHEGWTPLHAAQWFRDDEASELLLSLGANVNAIDAAGRTPLHTSAVDGSDSGARVLCASGADVTLLDRQGRTAYDLALKVGPTGRGAHRPEEPPGELAGWLRPGGGCQELAARARPGHPASRDDIVEIWRRYACALVPSPCAGQPEP